MGRFTWISLFNSHGGYGKAALKLAWALREVGAQLRVASLHRLDGRRFEGRAVVLAVPDHWPKVIADELVGFTMWETSRLPGYWVETLNGCADAVLVPSQANREVFESSGVTRPIGVVPLGVDQGEFSYIVRPERGVYTFLCLGELILRKNWHLVYRAFHQVFGDSLEARLILKTRGFGKVPECVDANVEVIAAEYGMGMMRELYAAVDCFVFPSSGEGFGLPPREAAATGLPVIATDWSGLQEGGLENYAYPLAVGRMVRAEYGPQETRDQIGEWALPDFEHLCYLMRYCFENREAAREKGRRAAEWVRENCGWDRAARRLLELVN